MRLIDADALEERIYNDIPIKVFGTVKRMGMMRTIIAEQPTVDAVPVAHGAWVKHSKHNGIYFCSRCKAVSLSNGRFPYCSECGAKMDGERRESE